MRNLFEEIIEKERSDYRILKENDPLLLIIWSFYEYDIEKISIFYSIIILKSVLTFDFNKKNRFESSDFVLNRCVEYFEHFIIFFHNSNYDFKFFDKKQIRTHFFLIYEFLVKKKIIESKTIWVKKGDNFITEKFWGISNFSCIPSIDTFNIFISKPDIKIFNTRYFLIGGYYNKVFEIFKKNINSGLSFSLNDDWLLNKINSTEWHLDIEWFEKIINLMKKELNSSLEKNSINNALLIEKLNKCDWKDEDLQKEYSINLHYLNIHNYFWYLKKLNLTTPLYFPFYFDFRGRMYYNSSICITSCKILRTIYYYGFYNEQDFSKPVDDRFDTLLKKYSNEIYEIKTKFNIKLNWNKVDIGILFILISMGKFTIEKGRHKIHMDEFVLEGLRSINDSFERIKKFEDLIEVLSYEQALINFHQKKKRIIIKDFTASFFQHLTRLLGPKNLITLELANMNNDLFWNDPYSYFIDNFLKKYNINNSSYFTRNFLKKTIMTIPYSIGNKAAWGYFALNLNEGEKNNKEIRKEYNLFFSYVKSALEGTHFFKNSTDRIILYAISKVFWFKNLEIKIGKSFVHLIYFKHKSKILDLTIKFDKETIRITKKINEINKEEIDFENIAISVRANWIAMMDGNTLRSLHKLMKRPLFTIHDCILIDWLNIDNLIISCNEVLKDNDIEEISWNNSHNYEIFSFFVIL